MKYPGQGEKRIENCLGSNLDYVLILSKKVSRMRLDDGVHGQWYKGKHVGFGLRVGDRDRVGLNSGSTGINENQELVREENGPS
jgi:hypothetical protein